MIDLNGHYCLATKEHYNKLVKDGYIPSHDLCDNIFICRYYELSEGKIYDGDVISSDQPMHLRNNEWVEGSLEHVTDIDVGDIPKIVERITREVVSFEGEIQHDYNTGKDLIVLPNGRSTGKVMCVDEDTMMSAIVTCHSCSNSKPVEHIAATKFEIVYTDVKGRKKTITQPLLDGYTFNIEIVNQKETK